MANINLFLNASHFTTTSTMKLTFPGTTRFPNSEIALVSLSIYNQYQNISASLGNNTVNLIYPVFTGANTYTMTTYTLTIPDGYYNLSEDLDRVISLFCVNQGKYLLDASGNAVVFQKLIVNESTYAMELYSYYIPTQAQVTAMGWSNPAGMVLNSGNQMVVPRLTISTGLSTLTGIISATYPSTVLTSTAANWSNNSAQIYAGTKAPQVNAVTALSIRTADNFVSSKLQQPTNVLVQVPIRSSYGGLGYYEPTNPIFVPISDRDYQSIELEFWDQAGRRLYLKDGEINATLVIRTIK